MFKTFVTGVVLVLVLAGLIGQREAGEDALNRLNGWLVRKPGFPGLKVSPIRAFAEYIAFVNRTAESEGSLKGLDEKSKELLHAIAQLDPDPKCDYDNLLAIKGLVSILEWKPKRSKSAIQPGPLFDPRPLVASLGAYLERAMRCFHDLERTWTRRREKLLVLDYIDRLIIGPFPHTKKRLDGFRLILKQYELLNTSEPRFSGSELLGTLWDAHERKVRKGAYMRKVYKPVDREQLTSDQLRKFFNEYLIKPCEKYVETVPKHLESIILLYSFLQPEIFGVRYEPEASHTMSLMFTSRYMVCKILLKPDLEKLVGAALEAQINSCSIG